MTTDGFLAASNGRSSPFVANSVQEDEVDVYLSQLDGRIERPLDPKYCHHDNKSRCIHCFPVDPFDENYLLSKDIKHMSFHAYLRKLQSTMGKHKGPESKLFNLDSINCKIKPGCTSHRPWPAGICTKCQPNAITLNRQRFRHTDNISFDNQHFIGRFLNGWRQFGVQRVGLMYGRYTAHNDVPLGIKCNVVAIYEPPQLGTTDSVEFLEDPHEDYIHALAVALGLQRVGWIFTDFSSLDLKTGSVKHTRHMGTYFLSAEECITAAFLQNKHPNYCKRAKGGFFGSKFVTVVASGDQNNTPHLDGYQVSDQCMGLVRDNCLVPTKDAPELAFLRESTAQQYVPDVYYKEKDRYGNEIQKLARPLPVEYLIVDVPTGVRADPQFTFYANNKIKSFPIENRQAMGELQNIDSLKAYVNQFTANQFFEMVADFHVLLFLNTNAAFPIPLVIYEQLNPLLMAVRNQDRAAAYEWSQKNENWATIGQMLELHDVGTSSGSFTSGAQSAQPPWACKHCTFHNAADRADCEMCGLPKA